MKLPTIDFDTVEMILAFINITEHDVTVNR